MRRGWGRLALRTVWLLVGAAIGLAAGLLLVSLAQVIGGPMVLVVPLCLAPALLIGLLPGVRELEVTAARSLLGVRGDLVVPTAPTAAHRWRTAVLVFLHLVLGLLAAALLVGVAPGVVLLVVAGLQGRTETVSEVQLPAVPAVWAVPVGVLALAVVAVLVWAVGRLAAGAAARLLGPTAEDRLEVALTRLAAESQHVRLARELHDGIGHALTIISVQAEAARRGTGREPAQTDAALGAISTAARQALGELDDMLGLLRDGEAGRTPEPDLEQLPALLEAHRSAGLDVQADRAPDGLPRLVSTTAYRIVAEGLANAQRYAGSGPVRVEVRRAPDALVVALTSALTGRAPRTRGSGRGLMGITERVRLFGGTLTAGPAEAGPAGAGHWVLRAEIPLERHG